MEESKNTDFKGIGLTKGEKNKAKKRCEEYKQRYHIESLSDIQLLEQLVFREILQERTKKQVRKVTKAKKKVEENAISPYLLKVLNENEERILILKEKLGLFEEKKGEDPFKYIQRLKKKFKKWREENQGSRTLICPHCSKMVILKIRTKAWEALKHPFFKDRILANKHLWDLHRKGKITKEDIAKVLGCSPDYVEWLEEKIYSKPSE